MLTRTFTLTSLGLLLAIATLVNNAVAGPTKHPDTFGRIQPPVLNSCVTTSSCLDKTLPGGIRCDKDPKTGKLTNCVGHL
jgi:hypothetical protein